MNYECSNEHIGIIYGSQPCPLCASHAAIAKLRECLVLFLDWLDGRSAKPAISFIKDKAKCVLAETSKEGEG